MEPAMSQAGRPSRLDPQIAARLKRDPAGLVAAIAQQYDTGEVLMLGWMDEEALHRTLTTGRCTYWSRSRQEYWVKGETSGHVQRVVSAALDCDGDAVLVKVDQAGGACHTGDRTCFDADVLLPAPGQDGVETCMTTPSPASSQATMPLECPQGESQLPPLQPASTRVRAIGRTNRRATSRRSGRRDNEVIEPVSLGRSRACRQSGFRSRQRTDGTVRLS